MKVFKAALLALLFAAARTQDEPMGDKDFDLDGDMDLDENMGLENLSEEALRLLDEVKKVED